jgi:CDP-diacylglycerol--glycerol-3-phosphate 3-phosphatidyltransferase
VVNVPNVVTVARVILAFITLSLLFSASDCKLWIAFGLTIVVIWADGLDGYFARKLNQASKLGAVLDIAGDRVVEMAYWIVFASLGWIPVWVPLLFLVRGTFVDAIRAHASEQGFTAFGEKTMMQSGIGKFLVASNFSRFTYAVAKAVAFCFLIAAQTSVSSVYHLPEIANAFLYIACVFCVIRGLPVLIEAPALFRAGK